MRVAAGVRKMQMFRLAAFTINDCNAIQWDRNCFDNMIMMGQKLDWIFHM